MGPGVPPFEIRLGRGALQPPSSHRGLLPPTYSAAPQQQNVSGLCLEKHFCCSSPDHVAGVGPSLAATSRISASSLSPPRSACNRRSVTRRSRAAVMRPPQLPGGSVLEGSDDVSVSGKRDTQSAAATIQRPHADPDLLHRVMPRLEKDVAGLTPCEATGRERVRPVRPQEI